MSGGRIAPSSPASTTALLRMVDGAVSPELHAAAWQVCNSDRWAFGNRSRTERTQPFWKMELAGDPTFDAIWRALQPGYETLVGSPLRVLRQYANAHTYGLGGEPHRDDVRPGTYTLLYYPMPVWKTEWDGETVFYDGHEEVVLAARPRPNRAILFDSRILHVGRAPSRSCPELRVTVAYKLGSATTPDAPLTDPRAGP